MNKVLTLGPAGPAAQDVCAGPRCLGVTPPNPLDLQPFSGLSAMPLRLVDPEPQQHEFRDDDMHEIRPRLFVGNLHAAYNVTRLSQCGIQTVLTCEPHAEAPLDAEQGAVCAWRMWDMEATSTPPPLPINLLTCGRSGASLRAGSSGKAVAASVLWNVG